MTLTYIGWTAVEDTMKGRIEVVVESQENAMALARKNKTPYVITHEDELRCENKLPFPFIGMRTPIGWKRIDKWFCDHSGWGAPDEPALTVEALTDRIRERIRAGKLYGYGIISTGQFQLWLGVFEKSDKT